MKDEQLYQELKNLAEKLEVTVAEHSFKNAGVAVKSGFCVVKSKKHCIIDRNARLKVKIDVLAELLARIPHEHIFVVPAVRDLLDSLSIDNAIWKNRH